ncbi:MAG: hypothetical protein GDA56_26645 [Hormoscilla sp. GM7CHS1pb]|nr:hypothetical protein [Hormoscilla sp. GM7CHS1pb]
MESDCQCSYSRINSPSVRTDSTAVRDDELLRLRLGEWIDENKEPDVTLAPSMGRDTIFNFEDGTDKIGLGGGLSFSDLEIVGRGSSTRIKTLDTGETLATLRKIDDALIGADDFV